MGGLVWSAKEWWDCLVTLIDVGDKFPAGGDMVCLTRIGVVVGEVGDRPQCSLPYF